MTTPAFNFDKSKQNFKPKCFYMMNLIKSKSQKVWEEYKEQFEKLEVEGSFDFYFTLVEAYKKLDGKEEKKPTPVKAAPKKVLAEKKAAAEKKFAAKKPVAKKPAVKKAAKKKAAKKTAAKKSAPKKAAKKTVKKSKK